MGNKLDRDPMEHVAKCDECGELFHIAELVPKKDGENTIIVCEKCKEDE